MPSGSFSKRTRNIDSVVNRKNCGGNKKAGLAPRATGPTQFRNVAFNTKPAVNFKVHQLECPINYRNNPGGQCAGGVGALASTRSRGCNNIGNVSRPVLLPLSGSSPITITPPEIPSNTPPTPITPPEIPSNTPPSSGPAAVRAGFDEGEVRNLIDNISMPLYSETLTQQSFFTPGTVAFENDALQTNEYVNQVAVICDADSFPGDNSTRYLFQDGWNNSGNPDDGLTLYTGNGIIVSRINNQIFVSTDEEEFVGKVIAVLYFTITAPAPGPGVTELTPSVVPLTLGGSYNFVLYNSRCLTYAVGCNSERVTANYYYSISTRNLRLTPTNSVQLTRTPTPFINLSTSTA